MSHEKYRYVLHVDIPATDVRVLLDAFEGEALELKDHLGEAELQRQLHSSVLSLDTVFPTRWAGLESDLEILSTYLAAPVVATEVVERAHGVSEAWRLIAHRGEVVRVALELDDSHGILGEDVDELVRQLPALPRWAQSLLAPRIPRSA